MPFILPPPPLPKISQNNISKKIKYNGCDSSFQHNYRLNYNQVSNSQQTDSDKAVKPKNKKVRCPKVIIVDNFKDKTVQLDDKEERMLSHGEIIAKIIEKENPNIELEGISIDFNNDEQIQEAFKIIAENAKGDKNIKGVNFSAATLVQLSKFGKPVLLRDPNYKKAFKDDVKKIIKKVLPGFYKSIQSIEKVTSMGIPVYISGGNQGVKKFNLYSCANGVITVGATDKGGNKIAISANSKLVDRYEQGVFNPDYFKKRSCEDNNSLINIEGTSLSTPVAIAKDFKY